MCLGLACVHCDQSILNFAAQVHASEELLVLDRLVVNVIHYQIIRCLLLCILISIMSILMN